MPVSCAKPEPTAPPPETPKPTEFAIIALDIDPNGVMPGDPVTVTATIQNTGETKGIYTAILTMDQQELERKDVLVGPGATETAVFNVTSPEAGGSYKLNVGEAGNTLTVFDWTAYTLQYDNARCSQYGSLFGDGGFLTCFSLPSSTFKIQKIRIYGYVGGKNLRDWSKRNFTLRIWNKELSQELWSQSCPYDLFSTTDADWAEVEVPDIRVGADFYVEVTTYSTRETGIYINFDSSIPNEHSYMSRNGKIIPWEPWTWEGVEYTKEKVNWMIRVRGTATVPEE